MLPTFTYPVESQYYKPELFEDILNRLEEQDIDLNSVSRSHIHGVDEFHVRGAEVSKELVRGLDLKGSTVLDVGCGIGGPARMLADELNCKVTGVDLSAEFIRTAQRLSELVGLNDNTTFIQADALELPFKDGSFDVVWTQHVQMNIEDKQKFYSEIRRVLKDRGMFIFYDIFKLNGKDIQYPVPWANDKSVSHLATPSEMNNMLQGFGFKKLRSTDQTHKARLFLIGLFEKIKKNGPPKIGLNVLMGKSTKEKLNNILDGLEEEKLALQSGVYCA